MKEKLILCNKCNRKTIHIPSADKKHNLVDWHCKNCEDINKTTEVKNPSLNCDCECNQNKNFIATYKENNKGKRKFVKRVPMKLRD